MTTKDEKIAALKKLLEKAEAKIARKEDQLKEERQKRKDAEAAIITAYMLFPSLQKLSAESITELLQLFENDPTVALDRLTVLLQELADGFTSLTKNKVIQRLFAGGTEKIGRPKRQKNAPAANDVDTAKDNVAKAVRALKKRQDELRRTQEVAAEAAKKAAQEIPGNDALAAASRIADTAEPEIQEFERQPSVGRQFAEAKADARSDSEEKLDNPTCPHCHQAGNIITGRLLGKKLRSVASQLNETADFVDTQTENCYCNKCRKIFCVCTNDDVPAKPKREMGQSLLIAATQLYCNGMPLNKVMQLLFPEKAQLGKDTLGENLHTWALDTLKPLAECIFHVMYKQHTLLMDETPLTVLQSKGQGICQNPKDGDLRSKDYIGVQCSAPGATQQCIRFIYLGSRSGERIHETLKDVQAKVLVTDGYAPYASYCQGADRPTAQNCIVHLRRYLLDALSIPNINKYLFDTNPDEAVKKAKSKFESGSSAFMLCSVLQAFSKIYGYEKTLKRKPGETDEQHRQRVLQCRQKYAKPLMDDVDIIMCELAKKLTIQTKSGTYESANKTFQEGGAVAYYMNRRQSFRTFLNDPEVPPDSNAVERAIRPVTVLRKVTDFKQSQERMESYCILMSLFETAKANNVKDFFAWLGAYCHAFYYYRAEKTLNRMLQKSGDVACVLNTRLEAFDDDSGEGFDFTPHLPWNQPK